MTTADSVIHADWIAAQLRKLLASPDPQHSIKYVLGDVELWTSEANEVVAAITQRQALPELQWTRRFGPVGRLRKGSGLSPWLPTLSAVVTEGHELAIRWAIELRLREVDDPVPGTRCWAGVIEGWNVEVLLVTDRQALFATRPN